MSLEARDLRRLLLTRSYALCTVLQRYHAQMEQSEAMSAVTRLVRLHALDSILEISLQLCRTFRGRWDITCLDITDFTPFVEMYRKRAAQFTLLSHPGVIARMDCTASGRPSAVPRSCLRSENGRDADFTEINKPTLSEFRPDSS